MCCRAVRWMRERCVLREEGRDGEVEANWSHGKSTFGFWLVRVTKERAYLRGRKARATIQSYGESAAVEDKATDPLFILSNYAWGTQQPVAVLTDRLARCNSHRLLPHLALVVSVSQAWSVSYSWGGIPFSEISVFSRCSRVRNCTHRCVDVERIRLIGRRRRVYNPPETLLQYHSTVLPVLIIGVAVIERIAEEIMALLPAQGPWAEALGIGVVDMETDEDLALLGVLGRRVQMVIIVVCEQDVLDDVELLRVDMLATKQGEGESHTMLVPISIPVHAHRISYERVSNLLISRQLDCNSTYRCLL